ncbi:class I poly(R)-hydroxyalkanoic acid synthase [Propionivibrio sp.]|uniref:PHA/PHB synthase family protein n=1 Tax=Propionivibrio sp. TaxID=2212460 RepID=UPI0025FE14B2|nr:class I poly(R)-hydroxyalkanoic acid synthase [Propionivibrio sp.]
MAFSSESFAPATQMFAQVSQALMQGLTDILESQPQAAGISGPSLGLPDPICYVEWQNGFLEKHLQLWHSMLERKPDEPLLPVIDIDPADRRFASPEWRSSPVFDYIRYAYLLNSQCIRDLVELFPASDERTKDRARFLARQFIDALSPANFAATNPEFIRRALDTQGQCITDGITNLIGDFGKGRVSITDESAFEIGRNLAMTPGTVIFENELIQLIQYAPTTPKAAQRPLLIVPPCINKFYVLDLQPENSFVRYAVEQGNTVFLVSWRNPGDPLGHLTWHDYLEDGPIAAIDVVRDICQVDQVNVLGWCVGGTILTSALSVLAARGENKVASLTLLTTLLDYSEAGELGLFIDEQSIAEREAAMAHGGIMKGSELSGVFSMLRANDLVWNYVASNYLKGSKPKAFDLLYWNSDSTNLPGPFACWYLRNLYLENGLRVPGKLEMCGVKIDLGRVQAPNYILAAREDHIVPWKASYLGTQLLGGASRFVLGASGHIAGVINPASKNKRSFWLNAASSDNADDWLLGAEEHQGSWWNDWSRWLKQFGDGDRAAPSEPGNARFKPIEPAPGRYVKECA